MTEIDETETGAETTRREACLVWPPPVPLMMTFVSLPTALQVTLNVADVAAAGTRTFAGTEAATFELESVTNSPPVVAGTLRVTVPVIVAGPVTALWLSERALKAGGTHFLTWTVTVLVAPAP